MCTIAFFFPIAWRWLLHPCESALCSLACWGGLHIYMISNIRKSVYIYELVFYFKNQGF
jgi:hypothetical protein